MRHKTGLRRLRGVVSLANLRCSGIDHGGCQAACQFLWKDAWLERVSASRGPSSARERNDVPSPPGNTRQPSNGADTYVCQMTRLWEASAPMSRFDVRQDLRPLLSGNIRFGAYLLIMLTRLFNGAQRLRNGVGFPAMPPPREKGALRPHASNFAEGQAAFVRDRGEISSTLTNSRNKGLWFDSDMIRFCGQFAVVHSRVDKLIHEATGKMVIMKTPCVTLDGIVATGEFLRLCPQHEFIFWREAWLRPGASDDNATAADHMR